ncbi:MAG: SDR family oxidoreductase [Archangium sp.]
MIVVTGASGHLGRLIVEQLRAKNVPVVAAVRTPEKAQNLSALGAEIRHADYEKPETLDVALKGADTLILVSGSEVGRRLPQHTNVVNAAKKAGVKRIVYTSILRAPTSTLALAGEHKATEELIAASGIPYTFLRNGWYIENYTGQTGGALAQGKIFGASGEGRVSAASRADFAAAAVAVATGPGHENKAYELGGHAVTLPQYAKALSAWAGKPIEYVNQRKNEYRDLLVKVGVPAPFAEILADSDDGISRGELEVPTTDLEKLIGRTPETFEQVLARTAKP